MTSLRLKGVEVYLGVSKNNGTPKSSILIGFSIIFTIHFGGPPQFLETSILQALNHENLSLPPPPILDLRTRWKLTTMIV